MSERQHYKAYLRVRNLKTREIAHSVGLTNISPRHVERVMRGMLINMSDDYFIDDSEVDAARLTETGSAADDQ